MHKYLGRIAGFNGSLEAVLCVVKCEYRFVNTIGPSSYVLKLYIAWP
jgi:hypothetical protein